MMFKLLTRLILLALFAAAALLHAEAQRGDIVNVDFSTLLWAGQSVPYDVYYLDAQGQPQPVSLQSSRRSRVVTYRGSSPLVFVRKERGAAAEVPWSEIGRIELSASIPRILVLFVQPPDSGQMNILTLDDGAEHFPPGSYKFINVTNSVLGLQFDEQMLGLPAGAQRVCKLPAGAKDNAVAVRVNRAGSESAAFAGVWPYFPPLRTLVFFYAKNGSTDDGIDVFMVSDVVVQPRSGQSPERPAE